MFFLSEISIYRGSSLGVTHRLAAGEEERLAAVGRAASTGGAGVDEIDADDAGGRRGAGHHRPVDAGSAVGVVAEDAVRFVGLVEGVVDERVRDLAQTAPARPRRLAVAGVARVPTLRQPVQVDGAAGRRRARRRRHAGRQRRRLDAVGAPASRRPHQQTQFRLGLAAAVVVAVVAVVAAVVVAAAEVLVVVVVVDVQHVQFHGQTVGLDAIQFATCRHVARVGHFCICRKKKEFLFFFLNYESDRIR